MPKISVANIKIDFTYVYPDYFDSLVESYLIADTEVDHSITVLVASDFDVDEELQLKATYKNRKVYESEKEIHIAAYNDIGICKQYIRHTKDYQHITITLHASDTRERLIELEYVLTGLLFVELALFHNRLALHASAINVNGEGILFSANSGTGKSTHANHWIQNYDATFVNDDKPLLYMDNSQFVVSGTPWCGKDFLQNNTTIPLKAVVFLERGNNELYTMTNKEKIIQLIKNTVRPRNEILMGAATNIIDKLVNQIEIINYQATIDSNSTRNIYNHLFGGNHEN